MRVLFRFDLFVSRFITLFKRGEFEGKGEGGRGKKV